MFLPPYTSVQLAFHAALQKLPFLFENYSAVSETLPLAGSSVMLWGGHFQSQPRPHPQAVCGRPSLSLSWEKQQGSSQHVATRVQRADRWVGGVHELSFLSWWWTPSFPHATRISYSLSWKLDSNKIISKQGLYSSLMGCWLQVLLPEFSPGPSFVFPLLSVVHCL